MTQWVYGFGDGRAEGRANMRDLLGGKGANLAEMSNLGLPVPPGFTVTTEVCTHYYANDESYPAELTDQVACHTVTVRTKTPQTVMLSANCRAGNICPARSQPAKSPTKK